MHFAGRIFALDSVVVKTQKLFSLHGCFLMYVMRHQSETICQIYRNTIEGFLDSVPSLTTFNAIKTKLIMHALYSSRYLQSKWMLNVSHASMVKVQYSPNGLTFSTEKSQTFKHD